MPRPRYSVYSLRGYVRDRVRAGDGVGHTVDQARQRFPGATVATIRQVTQEERRRRESVLRLTSARPTSLINLEGCAPAGQRSGAVRVGMEIVVRRRDGTRKVYGVEVEIDAARGQVRQLVAAAVATAIAHAAASGYTANTVDSYVDDLGSAADADLRGSLALNYVEC